MLDQRRLLPDLLERQVLRFHRLLPFRYDLYSRPSMHNVRVQRRLLSIWYLGLERLFDGLLSFRPIGIEWCLRLPSGSAEIVLRFDQVCPSARVACHIAYPSVARPAPARSPVIACATRRNRRLTPAVPLASADVLRDGLTTTPSAAHLARPRRPKVSAAALVPNRR